MLVAAISHDVDHTGRTNAFEIESGSHLALRYHDNAVLEQHHTATMFLILNMPDCNLFANLDNSQRKYARKFMINAIMYTDMSKHFKLINDVNIRLDEAKS